MEASTSRREYVLDHAAGAGEARLGAVLHLLNEVCAAATAAEADIPWQRSTRWPAHVVAAARRLDGQAGGGDERRGRLARTGLWPLLDERTREDFVTVAPYADAATFFDEEGVVARLSDEAGSVVVEVTEERRQSLERAMGQGRLVPLGEWRAARPAGLRRLLRRVARPRG